MADKDRSSWTGLNDEEAQEFHNYYLQGTVIFTVVAIVAHYLVWIWRPWIPPSEGYASLIDGVKGVATTILPFVA